MHSWGKRKTRRGPVACGGTTGTKDTEYDLVAVTVMASPKLNTTDRLGLKSLAEPVAGSRLAPSLQNVAPQTSSSLAFRIQHSRIVFGMP